MTRDEIIITAAEWASVGEISKEEIDRYTPIYNQLLDDLLKRRKWRFLLDILPASDFKKVEGRKNLGYKYVYEAPSRVLEVLDLNPQIRTPILDKERALDFGIVIPTDYIEGGDPTSDFVFDNGQLHTDHEFETAVVQYRVDEVEMESSFRSALIYKVAAFLSFSVVKNGADSNMLEKKFREQYIAAMDDLKPTNTINLYERALIDWIEKYNAGLSYI